MSLWYLLVLNALSIRCGGQDVQVTDSKCWQLAPSVTFVLFPG